MRRFAAIVLAITLCLLSGCNPVKNKAMAQSAVVNFHSQLDAEDFHGIYAASAPGLKTSVSEEQWNKFLGAIHRKLGKVKSSDLESWRTFSGMGGTTMQVTFKTQFEKSEGTEDFNWLFVDGKPQLLGYNIRSMGLITD
jgi:uncharacterized protein DUF4019